MVIMMAFMSSLLLLSCGGAGDPNGSDTTLKTDVISDSNEELDNTIIKKAQEIIQNKLIDVKVISSTEYRIYINDFIATPIKDLLKDTKKEHQIRYLGEILDYKSLDTLSKWRKDNCLPVLEELLYNNANNIDEVREKAEKANKGVEDLKKQVAEVVDSVKICQGKITEIGNEQSVLKDDKIGWLEAMICVAVGVVISILFTLIFYNKLNSKINDLNNAEKSNPKNFQNIEAKIKGLEDKVNNLKINQVNKVPFQTSKPKEINRPKENIVQKKIVESSNSTEYIGEYERSTLFKTSKELDGSMYFKVEWKDVNKTEGVISLIDLDRVKSNDSVQKYYIESTGCSFGVAKNYQERAKGKIVKINDSEWELKEKIKIILY